MELSELRDLDYNNLGAASTGAKAVILGFLALLIIGLGYYFLIMGQARRAGKQGAIRGSAQAGVPGKISRKPPTWKPTSASSRKWEDMLAGMLEQLPSKTEMPALLMDVSQTAQGIRNWYRIIRAKSRGPA